MLAKSLSGAAAALPAYIEDVFSTYLYTGNGATQTITNGIDLSGKGGLVWIKGRSGATGHRLTDTVRGATKSLESNGTAAEVTESTGLTAFGSTGFTIGADTDYNTSSATYVSWAFREQAKFFDVVTYTGNGANRTIAHNLGSVPGCIIVKRTDTTGDWQVYHRSLANTEYMVLNSTAAKATGTTRWNSTTPTSTEFSLGTDTTVNASGGTYVAYLFAHDAGGFGLTGTDNVISCGSYTGNGSTTGPVVTLGYEPQLVFIKNSSGTGNWQILDNMRGIPVGSADATLQANLSNAESSVDYLSPTATGFQITSTSTQVNTNASTYIYIAIRRGPMKVPTSGTSVFSPILWTGDNAASRVITTTNMSVPDAGLLFSRSSTGFYFTSGIYDRLRSIPVLETSSTQTESYWAGTAIDFGGFGQGRVTLPSNVAQWNSSPTTFGGEFFSRAPNFFDVVCYTGTGANSTVNHNLAAVPELMIVKRRNVAADWWVYDAATGNTKYQVLNTTATPVTSATAWNNTTPTSTVFTVGTGAPVNASSGTYVAYLFASLTGVSKVGSYTGTGALQTINCGFTSGARFVLVKRTDSAGDWYVYDSARGITSGNDPYILLNSTAAEVTGTNYVNTATTGFQVTAAAPAGLNANGGTFIFLAIA